MQAVAEPSPTSSSFAGVLAALSGARIKPSSNWEDDLERDLEPDVATLSYEHALSAHARYRPDHSLPDHSLDHFEDRLTEDSATRTAAAQSENVQKMTSPAERTVAQRISALEAKRMRASVTLRMSKAEFAQLQQRAAEAGLTVSAYLRSCTFEVESLRAQVKQALAELRIAPRESSPEPSRPPRTSWLAHFLEMMRILRPAAA